MSENYDRAKVRSLFEEWALDHGYRTETDDVGNYRDQDTHDAWCGWEGFATIKESLTVDHFEDSRDMVQVVKESLTTHAVGSALTDARAHEILLNMARECDEWGEGLNEEPTTEQCSGKAISIILREVASDDYHRGWQDGNATANRQHAALAAAPAPATSNPAGMGVLIALTREKNKLNTALELACNYLTDEQAAEVAAAMPTPSQDLTPGGSGEADRPKIDANDLERMAKERPNDYFLKGSGVLKLIAGIRTLEAQVRALATSDVPAVAVQAEPEDETPLFVQQAIDVALAAHPKPAARLCKHCTDANLECMACHPEPASPMPALTEAMRAVLRNEHGAYPDEDSLYADLCKAAGAPASPIEAALRALQIADKFCGSLTSDVCPDEVHIPIREAILALRSGAHTHVWRSEPNQPGYPREVCDCGAMRSGASAQPAGGADHG